MKSHLIVASLCASSVLVAQTQTGVQYPQSKKIEQVDDYFGAKVADPYRWLEDLDSAETKEWVDAQNRATFAYLERIPARRSIKERLTELWNYERYGTPSKRKGYYVFTKNDGLQNQSVLYKTDRLDGSPEVLLDPNKLSADGTVALSGRSFSEDGRYMAYATSASGSDWMQWQVREVKTATDRPDLVKWSKFSGAAWMNDGSGFYYSRFDAPKEGESLKGLNKNQKVYFHALGKTQDQDRLVYERPDKPDWGFGADVTDDGRFLIIYQSEGTEPKNRLFIQDVKQPGGRIAPFLDQFDAEYEVVGNDGERFYIQTDKDAPRGRLVAIDSRNPAPANWSALIPQGSGKEVMASVSMVNNRFVVIWRTDAHDKIKIYGLDGTFQNEVTLPTIGTVGVSGRRKDDELFYAFTSFTYPTTVYQYDFSSRTSNVFKQPKVDFKSDDYETSQVFYSSKDGTRVPMFLTHRKGLKRDGQNPTYLTGYGGFNITITPSFSPATIAWLDMGGIHAVANLRGGGEYGREWHDAGRLHHKRNVFDDFIAAAEYL
ncbi:MAG: prolyl oligopeptidase family serine peptidase, partial [Acidimicrobiia bacterium]